MNRVELKGIVRNIRKSHQVGNVSYDTFELVQGDNVFDVVFKEGLINKIKEGGEIQFSGNIRTHVDSGHVKLYVNTYFDEADNENKVEISGKIFKLEPLFTYKNGKSNIHFTVINTIEVSDGKVITSTIPCVARNQIARDISENFRLKDSANITGSLKCRVFQKGDELMVTHEVEVTGIESIV